VTDDGKLQRKKKRNRGPRSALRDEIFNLPNMLTMGRVAVIPLVVWCMGQSDDLLSGTIQAQRMAFWATSLFAAASITDFLDGWLARNLDMQSTFGRFLDPLADKLLVMACLIELVALDRTPDWLVVLLLSREVAITGLRALAAEEGFVVASDRFGKWKTALQMCGLIGLLIHFPAHTDFLLFAGVVDYHRVGMVLLLISMVFSLISAVGYMAAFIRTTFQAHASKIRSAS
jgi:CDP-diacylglycerol--glycerol-3-phosphate 3-phosphatidyltransferase